MTFRTTVTELVRRRYSCRTYQKIPIEEGRQRLLSEFLASNLTGPLGTAARFALVAATDQDRKSLKGLGTYGTIKGAAGFIVGAVEQGPKDLEDYGYLMEHAILFATDLGLGTCWLGGSFSKSSFTKKIAPARGESVPAVTAVGCIASGGRSKDWIRKGAGSDHRFPWARLFSEERFGEPIIPSQAGAYAEPLEMVRLAPSASNKQPWRIVRSGGNWHFYLQRTMGYGKGTMLFRVLRLADLQRVDMGIAMCHFELVARQCGLKGGWVVDDPGIEKPGESTEYTVSWFNAMD
ncbi:MAG: nitroreductase family protein [Dissulfurispiraceae bacterium]